MALRNCFDGLRPSRWGRSGRSRQAPISSSSDVAEVIAGAISVGAPAYNRGEIELCEEIYAETALSLLASGMLGSESRRLLQGTLDACSSLPTADMRAWALRRALDAVREEGYARRADGSVMMLAGNAESSEMEARSSASKGLFAIPPRPRAASCSGSKGLRANGPIPPYPGNGPGYGPGYGFPPNPGCSRGCRPGGPYGQASRSPYGTAAAGAAGAAGALFGIPLFRGVGMLLGF